MEILYSEIFEEFEAAKTRKEKIDVLRKHGHIRFKTFLAMIFDVNIEFDIEVPEYKPAPEPAGLNYTYLHNEVPKLYRFIKDHPERAPNINRKQLQQILLVVLESLHKDESKILVDVMKKKNPGVKYLTPKLVKEAFPDLVF